LPRGWKLSGAIRALDPPADFHRHGGFFIGGNSMTIKQVAEICGVDERTVKGWIKKASDKMPGLSDKLSDSEISKVASEYNLDETCAIIEQGMGKNAANLFR
jgi:hypothetical protein